MTKRFGDESTILIPEEPVDVSSLGCFDDMEYECWNLILKYAERFGVQITSDISFDLAKEVQDAILHMFEESGVEFKYE